MGCDQVPLFGILARGYTPSLLSLGSTPFWHDFTPFRHVAGWRAPDRLKNTAGWRLFQLSNSSYLSALNIYPQTGLYK